MAAHKVPQDVEADDKFLGPLSFKQFLFGGGTAITGYMIYFTLSSGLWFLSIFIFPVFLLFAGLTFPWSKDQPTELWLGARLRYFIKPRRRIWDQSGMKDLVTITAPATVGHVYTDGLSIGEVQNRMSALANIVDSRGWAVKNYGTLTIPKNDSDRLVAPVENAPTDLEEVAQTMPDVMEERSGVIAQQFDSMIQKSEKKHKDTTKDIIEKARQDIGQTASADNKPKKIIPKKQEDFWFAEQAMGPSSKYATFQSGPVIAPQSSSQQSTQDPATNTEIDNNKPVKSNTMSEEELLERAHQEERRGALQRGPQHEKVVKPYDAKAEAEEQRRKAEEDRIIQQQEFERLEAEKKAQAQANSTVTPITDPDILELANNNDLNVATLSRQANKDRDLPEDEVVISLH